MFPKEPATLNDIDVCGSWSTTGGSNPQQFLIYDSDAGSDRMLVFSGPEQLRHLAVSDKWFMDGKFDMAPKQFMQLYIIRAAVATSAVICVYALLAGIYYSAFISIELSLLLGLMNLQTTELYFTASVTYCN